LSFVSAVPEALVSAGTDLDNLGLALRGAHLAAAGPTTGPLAAAGDEVSVAIAEVFGKHATAYQALSDQAAAFHAQYVRALSGAAGSYAERGAGGAGRDQRAH
jgi:hypothetical protein